MNIRSFVFTLNNYKEGDIELIEKTFKYRYLVIGREVGPENGIPHLQGYCQLSGRMALAKVGRTFHWHVEPTRGLPAQAADYCKKSGEFVEFGQLSDSHSGGNIEANRWHRNLELAESGSLSELRQVDPQAYTVYYRTFRAVRVDNLRPNPCDRLCIWLYGATGTGKTRWIHETYKDDIYWKRNAKWFDGYSGQSVIVMDDFGLSHKCLGDELKRWSDRYPVLGEVKGGTVALQHKVFIVSSNYHPNQIWGDDLAGMLGPIERRFKIIEVKKETNISEKLSIGEIDSYLTFNGTNT